jgi:hypothetical protein
MQLIEQLEDYIFKYETIEFVDIKRCKTTEIYYTIVTNIEVANSEHLQLTLKIKFF